MLVPFLWSLDLNHFPLFSLRPQHLYNLVHLDLSYNKLSSLKGVHTKLGNIKTLNLAGNLLESLSGLHKLYSLVNLDLSNNKIEQVSCVSTGSRGSGMTASVFIMLKKNGKFPVIHKRPSEVLSYCRSVRRRDGNGIRVLQMAEVRSIGSLPCLEHLLLLSNPLSIIPDYRTKVLAQFGERASEVGCQGGVGWGGAG